MEGIYLINKQVNMTSYDCIRKFKSLTRLKIGHAGTLDPFAEGLLIIMVGRATKLSTLFINHDKIYEGTIAFGISTDTYDSTGKIVDKLENYKATEEAVNSAISKLSGKTTQIPPKYSSIKVKGKKLYDYARKNEEVSIPIREVNVEFLSYSLKKESLSFKVRVSKGTYIRSLAHDLGVLLGIPSHLKSLKRLQSGPFKVEDAYQIKTIEAGIIPTITLLDYANSLDKVVIKPYLEKLVLNGIRLDERQTHLEDTFSVYNQEGKLLAIYSPLKQEYSPIILFGDDI